MPAAIGAAKPEAESSEAEMKPPLPSTSTSTAPASTRSSAGRPAKTIETRDVNLFYGDFQAVEGVTMTVEPNKVTALIGSSGCGKTTFLRSLNRMHELTAGARTEGEITLDGQDVYGRGVDPVQVRRLVGMVFQQPNPFPAMSIYDNAAAGLSLSQGKVKRADRDAIVERSLRGAHLWNEVKDRLDKPGASLSGGQQQRLCIARAIAVEPEVLLMDEPCSALDPVATLAIEDLIGELKTKYTIAIVTHNMQQASRASDVTAFFNLEATGKPGRLVEIGPTEKIFTSPSQQATEDYVSGRFG
jgi:phosphate transport system ATP-binding protein